MAINRSHFSHIWNVSLPRYVMAVQNHKNKIVQNERLKIITSKFFILPLKSPFELVSSQHALFSSSHHDLSNRSSLQFCFLQQPSQRISKAYTTSIGLHLLEVSYTTSPSSYPTEKNPTMVFLWWIRLCRNSMPKTSSKACIGYILDAPSSSC